MVYDWHAMKHTTPQPRIIRTSTPRTEMHNGTAQHVVTATWSNGNKTVEPVNRLAYFTETCTIKE